MFEVFPFDMESKLSVPVAVNPLFDEGRELSPPELLGDSGANPTIEFRLGDVFLQNFDDDSAPVVVSLGDRDRLIPRPVSSEC
jgi:hypothetical protein